MQITFMKLKFRKNFNLNFLTIALVFISSNSLAETILATVVSSTPVYDPSTYTLACTEWTDGQRCEKIARPDKPFPLPINFKTVIKLPNGSVHTLTSEERYDRGNRIKVEIEN